MNKIKSNTFNYYSFSYFFIFFIFLPNIAFSQFQLGSDINGDLNYDFLGTSVALNSMGDIMVVGIPHDYNPHNIPGRVRVYQYNGDDWQQLGNDVYGTVDNGGFGLTVDINAIGNIIAIGEPVNNTTSNPGNVEVYEFVGNEWLKLGQTLSGVEDGDVFGNSISLNDIGDILAVGIPSYNEDDKPGSVEIYQFNGSNWSLFGNKIDGINDKDDFGASVCLNSLGDILAVGAPSGSLNEDETGYVQIFEFINNEWVQLGENLLGEDMYDLFGSAVQLNDNGNIIAIGAPWDTISYVSIFEFMNNSWAPKGNKINAEIESIQLGYNISMDGTGNILALGLPKYNIGNADIGKVMTYKFIQDDWLKVGEDIIGEQEGEASGHGLDLNNFGDIVAIGAIGNDDANNNAGQVRVYNISERLFVNDLESNKYSIDVYPNPTNDILNIQVEGSISSIEITNLLGQTLLTSKGNSSREQIDISGLSAGNYFVKVVVGDGSQVLRVVVE